MGRKDLVPLDASCCVYLPGDSVQDDRELSSLWLSLNDFPGTRDPPAGGLPTAWGLPLALSLQ